MIIFNCLPKFIMVTSENGFIASYPKLHIILAWPHSTRAREPNSTPTKLSVRKTDPGALGVTEDRGSWAGLQRPKATWGHAQALGAEPGPAPKEAWSWALLGVETCLSVRCPRGALLTALRTALTPLWSGEPESARVPTLRRERKTAALGWRDLGEAHPRACGGGGLAGDTQDSGPVGSKPCASEAVSASGGQPVAGSNAYERAGLPPEGVS